MDHKNKVELIGWYGGDLTHAQSAWTSTNREMTSDKLERLPKLLNMLASEGHHTPFEKSMLHFLVETDIATHIHLLKHRIGTSANGECLTGDNLITFEYLYKNQRCRKSLKSVKSIYDAWNNGRHHQNAEKDKLYNRNRIRRQKIRVLNEQTGEFTYSNIKDIWHKGVQPVYKITTSDGSYITCTANHAIYTDNGYNTISNGLNVGDMIGMNGFKEINVAGKPYTFAEFFEDAHLYTANEFSKIKNIKLGCLRKWGYDFGIKFKPDPNKDFKKGNKPWNNGKKGTYHIDIKNRKHNPPKGELSNFWKGGISKERSLIGVWTTQQASKVHNKYNYTCQCCGENKGNTLHAHHIIPVSTDETKAYDFDNLITVCNKCHSEIHKSKDAEMSFAEYVMGSDFNIKSIDWGKNKKQRIGVKLKVHFEKITSIEYIGEQDTYDIEVEGSHNNFIANNIVVHNSARYKEIKEDKFLVPGDWDIGSYNSFDVTDNDLILDKWANKLIDASNETNKMYHECLAELTPILGRKRAKESARFFKMYNSQIIADISFNWRSFMHFQSLRNAKGAQKEVRDIAQQMMDIVKEIPGNPFKHSILSFENIK